MSKKKAYLISCSDHYGHRLHVTDRYLQSLGYETTYITSDFDHTTKQVFACHVPGCVQIHVRPYRKNLSLDRILSHREFARKVFRYLEQLPQQPDVVVALLPPNFLAHYAAGYKRRHPQVKLIFDIFDMWPETFPFGRLKKLLAPVFGIWARLRDRNLGAADYVTTECRMFRDMLDLPEDRSAAVYLCARPLSKTADEMCVPEEGLALCYLGAINNVIGTEEICGLIRALANRTAVTLHVIGTGERQQEFLDAAAAAGAKVEFYGSLYDDDKKQQIMAKCHFGLNLMKQSVCVGLTMKSLDYFRHGLPMISNIPGDTRLLVETEQVGVQWDERCAERILGMNHDDHLQMRKNAREAFSRHFEESVILAQYGRILNGILEC